MNDPTSEALDHIALVRLVGHYADAVTRRSWGEFADLFTDDAPITVDTVDSPPYEFVGPEEIGRFIGSAITRFSFFEFVILNFRSHFDETTPDAATGRLYMCELRQNADTREFSTAFGVYHDHFVRNDGVWRFARRHYQSLHRQPTGEVFAFPRPPGFDALFSVNSTS